MTRETGWGEDEREERERERESESLRPLVCSVLKGSNGSRNSHEPVSSPGYVGIQQLAIYLYSVAVLRRTNRISDFMMGILSTALRINQS